MQPRLIQFIAIVEGAIIVALELGFGHLITPHYGTSIQVWSTSIISTMLGMSAGYLTSVFFLHKISLKKTLYLYIYFSLYIGVLATFERSIILSTLNLNYAVGLWLCAFIFIFLNVFIFSMLLPIIIQSNSKNAIDTATSTGDVFFYSTLSSIIISILLGFFLFEKIGVKESIIVLSIASGTLLLLLSIIKYHINMVHISLFLAGVLGIFALKKEHNLKGVIFESDGLFGNLVVQDFGNNNNEGRRLFLNGSIQTMIYKSSGESYGQYPYLIRSLLPKATESQNKALLLGLGGGTIAYELDQKGYDVVAVELDERISEVARQYFYPNINYESVVMDGRFYINETNNRFNCIILDVFTSENPPYQLLSKESFSRISTLLAPNGILLINFNGFWTGKESFASKAVLKTLLATDFKVILYPTDQQEDQRNMIFYASKEDININRTVYYMDHASTSIQYSPEDLSYVPVLEDKKPVLPILNLGAANRWRKYGIEYLKGENQ